MSGIRIFEKEEAKLRSIMGSSLASLPSATRHCVNR
jgi:hypothetical protein